MFGDTAAFLTTRYACRHMTVASRYTAHARKLSPRRSPSALQALLPLSAILMRPEGNDAVAALLERKPRSLSDLAPLLPASQTPRAMVRALLRRVAPRPTRFGQRWAWATSLLPGSKAVFSFEPSQALPPPAVAPVILKPEGSFTWSRMGNKKKDDAAAAAPSPQRARARPSARPMSNVEGLLARALGEGARGVAGLSKSKPVPTSVSVVGFMEVDPVAAARRYSRFASLI